MIIKTQDDKNKALNRISLLVLEKPWEIEIKPYKKNRSLAQNKLMWEWFTVIGNDIGYTEKEMYYLMTDKFLPEIEYTGLDGEIKKRRQGTSSLKVKEFTVFLEHVDRWAVSEMGIILPCPEDVYFEAMGIRKNI
jgi:hypothetical protein